MELNTWWFCKTRSWKLFSFNLWHSQFYSHLKQKNESRSSQWKTLFWGPWFWIEKIHKADLVNWGSDSYWDDINRTLIFLSLDWLPLLTPKFYEAVGKNDYQKTVSICSLSRRYFTHIYTVHIDVLLSGDTIFPLAWLRKSKHLQRSVGAESESQSLPLFLGCTNRKHITGSACINQIWLQCIAVCVQRTWHPPREGAATSGGLGIISWKIGAWCRGGEGGGESGGVGGSSSLGGSLLGMIRPMGGGGGGGAVGAGGAGGAGGAAGVGPAGGSQIFCRDE